MKPLARLSLPTAALIVVLLLLAALIVSAPKHPVALIRVVDAAGRPIAGASIEPDGLRTKPGPYAGNHYGWSKDGVPNRRVSTDAEGYAPVPYPKYVTERLETGQISFRVSHPEYLSDRPFRVVTTAPPRGTPWRVWVDYVWGRIRHKAITSRTDPVVLQQGALLKISVRPNPAIPKDGKLFAQLPNWESQQTNFWTRPEPGTIVTRRLPPGKQAVRAVQFAGPNAAWFSEVTPVWGVPGQTNELRLELKPGLTVRGQLDPLVPRPVRQGRVVAQVWPRDYRPGDPAPYWHAWTAIGVDGGFELVSLLAGELEILALCQGFVSTNGSGKSLGQRQPQAHRLGTNDLTIVIGMEPTARLEVQVKDDQGNPLEGAQVSTWPNVRYGERFSTVLTDDCYNTADVLRLRPVTRSALALQHGADFQGASDRSGWAVLPNVPANVAEFNVEHARFTLPAVATPGGQKRRQASVALIPGTTNQVSVQLEPREQAPIAHF